jgi:simple sugar transport system ATP-binding protein
MMTTFGTPKYARHGFLRTEEIDRECEALISDFRIRAPNGNVLLQQLSGGNQQRTILAREMSRRPRLMVAAQPTRGLDVSAIEFVHALLLEHRREGGAILLVSTELNEVLALGDRIGVMVDGRMPSVLSAADANPEVLGLLMAGAGANA